jgi:hypothetical protein
VPLEDRPLRRAEQAALPQDLLGDRELPEVVEAARELRQFDLLARQSQTRRDTAREVRASADAARILAARSEPAANRARSASSTESVPAERTWFFPCSFAQ